MIRRSLVPITSFVSLKERSRHSLGVCRTEIDLCLGKMTKTFFYIGSVYDMDVVRCDVCSNQADLYCRSCDVKFCGECAGKHLKDQITKVHGIVPYSDRYSKPRVSQCCCQEQAECVLFCQKCKIAICGKCLLGAHKDHAVSDLSEVCQFRRQVIQKDTGFIESVLVKRVRKFIHELQKKKNCLQKDYEPLLNKIHMHGKKWHDVVDYVVSRHIDVVNGIMQRHLSSIDNNIAMAQEFLERAENIAVDNFRILKTNKAEQILKYETRLDEFQTDPDYEVCEIPNFIPNQLHNEDVFIKFGVLATGSQKTYQILSRVQDRMAPLTIDKHPSYEVIRSDFRCDNLVACVSKDDVWVTGKDKTMKHFNSHGVLLEKVDTLTGNWPSDVCVTEQGDLLYSDWNDNSVNLVNGGKVKKLLTLERWKPSGICVSSNGELLVCMQSLDEYESKVVRVSKSTVVQEVQYDNNDELYSGGGCTMFIAENKNFDICVSDFKARHVVVVNQRGKLRFKYNGRMYTDGGKFSPYAIDTDEMARIFVVDSGNRSIHVTDVDGHFLSYITECGSSEHMGLSIKDGAVFVGSGNSDTVTCFRYSS